MTALPEHLKDVVVLGDVMETLHCLPDNCLNMIYGDPDYGVGINYAGKKYTQRWNDYIDWYVELATECMRVLREDGNLFFINYPRQNSYLRVRCLDELAYEVFDYVWVYPTNVGHTPRRFTTAHRSVLHAVKSKKNAFYKEQVALPYKNPEDRRIKGRLANGSNGRMPYSWFEFNLVKNVSKDKTFHACQIPISLYDMLLKASTVEGDSVFVLFGGSGSEVVHTEQLCRTYLSSEIHPGYHQMIVERLRNNGEIGETHKIEMRNEQSLSWDIPEQTPLIEGLPPRQLQFQTESSQHK
ncbi:MAG: site-specific DNA-methyltransferase [Chloroflexota bacterium]|nr:site-specific DNA-methyltransferase [Chloroflexota bacterium]